MLELIEEKPNITPDKSLYGVVVGGYKSTFDGEDYYVTTCQANNSTNIFSDPKYQEYMKRSFFNKLININYDKTSNCMFISYNMTMFDFSFYTDIVNAREETSTINIYEMKNGNVCSICIDKEDVYNLEVIKRKMVDELFKYAYGSKKDSLYNFLNGAISFSLFVSDFKG